MAPSLASSLTSLLSDPHGTLSNPSTTTVTPSTDVLSSPSSSPTFRRSPTLRANLSTEPFKLGSSPAPPLQSLSEAIYEILNTNLSRKNEHFNALSETLRGGRIRVMHIDSAEAKTGKRHRFDQDGEGPEKLTAKAISSCFNYHATIYTANNATYARISGKGKSLTQPEGPKQVRQSAMNLSWAFWKPILVYAMMLQYDKKHVLDQLVQILHCLNDFDPPEELGRGFYRQLLGLEDAWNTFEFHAPLSPPPYTRVGALAQYRTLQEHWLVQHRLARKTIEFIKDVPFDAFPGFRMNAAQQPQLDSARATPRGQSLESGSRHSCDVVTQDNWRNLNDFLARLYAVKCKTLPELPGMLCPTEPAGWWLWKGLYPLIEAMETIIMTPAHEDASRATAIVWLSHHGLRLRQADFAEGIRRQTSLCLGGLSVSRMFVSITRARVPNAVGALNPLQDDFWEHIMPKRWDLWWNHLHELRAKVPADEADDATVSSKLIHALYAKLGAVRVDWYTNELIKCRDPELEFVFSGPAYGAAGEFDWQRDIGVAVSKERHRALLGRAGRENAPDRILRSRSEIEEHFRRRLYRLHSEQLVMYSIFEENAIRRKFMEFVNGRWRYRLHERIRNAREDVEDLVRQSGQEDSLLAYMAQCLEVPLLPEDCLEDLELRWLLAKIEEFRHLMRQPAPEADDCFLK